MAMELRHLRYFIVVAEEGHITRAAERLGIQQPPLSQRIKAIERELDVQLFRRKARGVELTDAGRAFLDNARAMLAHFDHTFETTRRTARGEQGRISVGVTPTSPFHPFVPRVIRAFRESYPQVFLRLEERLGNELVEQLRNEHIDVAFIRTPVAEPEGLVVDSLIEEPIVVALPRGPRVRPQRRPGRHFIAAAGARDIHSLRASRDGLLRPDRSGLPCRRLQSSRRTRNPADDVLAQLGGSRSRHLPGSGVAAAIAHGRRGLLPSQGTGPAEGRSKPRIAAR
jgi:DNA-binding transcriptional LysR family regulator